MDVFQKLAILSDAAKYDAACTSSGINRGGKKQPGMGSAMKAGICHSFAADGRCISLLKVLFTNHCIFDCRFCINRRSNETQRVAFEPRELADLTIHFYRRNYIEGLFLSSGVFRNPDYTCEQMIETLRILREEYCFTGYIHAKAIPGADNRLLHRLGLLADRMSVNIELPSQESLKRLAPDKEKSAILRPMGYITEQIDQNTNELVRYRHAPQFVPAGQSTQMIIGASPETDFHILHLTERLYQKYRLKRVFFSAYVPVAEHSLLPAPDTKPPLLREHRLYQADWLLRYYGFQARELLDEAHPNFNPLLDPKCNWALNHMELFPVEINTVPYPLLLRVPGIGVKSAKKIITARKSGSLDFCGLKKIGVVLKRARYFITCRGKVMEGLNITPEGAMRSLISEHGQRLAGFPFSGGEQLSFFAPSGMPEEVQRCLPNKM